MTPVIAVAITIYRTLSSRIAYPKTLTQIIAKN